MRGSVCSGQCQYISITRLAVHLFVLCGLEEGLGRMYDSDVNMHVCHKLTTCKSTSVCVCRFRSL